MRLAGAVVASWSYTRGYRFNSFNLVKNIITVITVRNEVAKVMFLHLSVILFMGGGVLSQHVLQVVSQHALQQVSGGGWSGGGACSWGGGVPGPGGGLLWGGVCSRGEPALGGSPPPPSESRWILLRTVRFLLVCILVVTEFR